MLDHRQIAERQSLIIEELSLLCRELINELSRYRNIEDEDKRLKGLEESGWNM